MNELVLSTKFKKQYKRMIKRNVDITKLDFVINLLLNNQVLLEKYKDHPLIGNYVGFRDCHIEPDWILIYKIEGGKLILLETGTHSDLL